MSVRGKRCRSRPDVDSINSLTTDAIIDSINDHTGDTIID